MNKLLFSDIDQCIVDIREASFAHVRHSAPVPGIDVVHSKHLTLHSFSENLREHQQVYQGLVRYYGLDGLDLRMQALEVERRFFRGFAECELREFDDAPPLPGVVDAYQKMIDNGITIVGLTARSEPNLPDVFIPDCINRTKAWVTRFKIPFADIIFGLNKLSRARDWQHQNPGYCLVGIVEDEPSKVLSLANATYAAESASFKVYVPRNSYNREILDRRETFLEPMGRTYEEAQAKWTRVLQSGRVVYVDSIEEVVQRLL